MFTLLLRLFYLLCIYIVIAKLQENNRKHEVNQDEIIKEKIMEVVRKEFPELKEELDNYFSLYLKNKKTEDYSITDEFLYYEKMILLASEFHNDTLITNVSYINENANYYARALFNENNTLKDDMVYRMVKKGLSPNIPLDFIFNRVNISATIYEFLSGTQNFDLISQILSLEIPIKYENYLIKDLKAINKEMVIVRYPVFFHPCISDDITVENVVRFINIVVSHGLDDDLFKILLTVTDKSGKNHKTNLVNYMRLIKWEKLGSVVYNIPTNSIREFEIAVGQIFINNELFRIYGDMYGFGEKFEDLNRTEQIHHKKLYHILQFLLESDLDLFKDEYMLLHQEYFFRLVYLADKKHQDVYLRRILEKGCSPNTLFPIRSADGDRLDLSAFEMYFYEKAYDLLDIIHEYSSEKIQLFTSISLQYGGDSNEYQVPFVLSEIINVNTPKSELMMMVNLLKKFGISIYDKNIIKNNNHNISLVELINEQYKTDYFRDILAMDDKHYYYKEAALLTLIITIAAIIYCYRVKKPKRSLADRIKQEQALNQLNQAKPVHPQTLPPIVEEEVENVVFMSEIEFEECKSDFENIMNNGSVYSKKVSVIQAHLEQVKKLIEKFKPFLNDKEVRVLKKSNEKLIDRYNNLTRSFDNKNGIYIAKINAVTSLLKQLLNLNIEKLEYSELTEDIILLYRKLHQELSIITYLDNHTKEITEFYTEHRKGVSALFDEIEAAKLAEAKRAAFKKEMEKAPMVDQAPAEEVLLEEPVMPKLDKPIKRPQQKRIENTFKTKKQILFFAPHEMPEIKVNQKKLIRFHAVILQDIRGRFEKRSYPYLADNFVMLARASFLLVLQSFFEIGQQLYGRNNRRILLRIRDIIVHQSHEEENFPFQFICQLAKRLSDFLIKLLDDVIQGKITDNVVLHELTVHFKELNNIPLLNQPIIERNFQKNKELLLKYWSHLSELPVKRDMKEDEFQGDEVEAASFMFAMIGEIMQQIHDQRITHDDHDSTRFNEILSDKKFKSLRNFLSKCYKIRNNMFHEINMNSPEDKLFIVSKLNEKDVFKMLQKVNHLSGALGEALAPFGEPQLRHFSSS